MMRTARIIFVFLFLCNQIITAQKQEAKIDQEDPSAVLPVLIRGPYLQKATSRSMLIRWRTDALSRSKVSFGTSPDQLNKYFEDSDLVTEHKVLISDLQPMTKYYYAIGAIKDKLQGDTSNYFYTLPLPGSRSGQTVRVAAVGDCGNNSVNQRNVRDQLINYLGTNYLNAWLLLGDNTYPDGTDAEFQTNFFNIYKDNLLKKYPLFPSPGNHDYHDIEFSAEVAQQTHEIAYYQNFSMPIDGESGGVPSGNPAFYSFDIGNTHFLSIDSYGKEAGTRLYDTTGAQVNWIKKDLEKAQSAEWIVAYWHHPPFTMGSHNSDTEKDLVSIRENFIQILERYGVDLVLCGHSHDYERSSMMNGYYKDEASFDRVKFTHGKVTTRNNPKNAGSIFNKKSLREKGAIYVVSGSAGQLGGKQTSFPHKAMSFSDADHGGVSLLEVTGNQLQLKWICADGIIRDQFTMTKN